MFWQFGQSLHQSGKKDDVPSLDEMTADHYPFEQKFLAAVSTRIMNEIKGINGVFYEIISKSPGTIEWE